MRRPALLLAGFLSFLPFVLALASGGSLRIGGATWVGVVLCPWLALAGLPRTSHDPGAVQAGARMRVSSWALVLGMLVPALALAVGTDLGVLGEDPVRTLASALGASTLVLLWSAAAVQGAGAGARGTAYGLAWLLLVPGAATLSWGLGWAPGASAGGDAGGLAWLELTSPLPWLAAAAERGPQPSSGRLLLGLAGNAGAVLLVLALVRGLASGEEEPTA